MFNFAVSEMLYTQALAEATFALLWNIQFFFPIQKVLMERSDAELSMGTVSVMSKAGSAAKIKLNSYDDLFGGAEMTAGADQVQEIPMSLKDIRLRCLTMKRCRKR